MSEGNCVSVCFLGDTAVGKTSIISKQQGIEIDPLNTITAESVYVTIDDQKLKLVDTAGQERFRSLSVPYYRQSPIAILVYNICDRHSFDGLKVFYEKLNEVNPDATVVVVGNKSDLPDRVVSDEEGSNFAKSINASFFITSARLGTGINELFAQVAHLAKEINIPVINNKVDITQIEQKKDGCC